MKNRTIQSIDYAQPMNMGGFPIRQPLPSNKTAMIDPFLLLHHANIEVSKEVDLKNAGVGAHPHRGFSPVTFIFDGGVHHRDSRGNDNVVYAGGTQWMNAGMGIIHSERPPADIHELGSRQEIIQLWINSPAKNKMDEPVYIPITAEETPTIKSADELTIIKVIAGKLNDTIGPIKPLSSIKMYTIQMQKGGTYSIPVEQSHNAFLYILKGKINVNNNEEVNEHNMVSFNKDGEYIELAALENSELLFGTGEPLNEPVASHGPFVMNNQIEIMEAFRDYQIGKMGVLIEN